MKFAIYDGLYGMDGTIGVAGRATQ